MPARFRCVMRAALLIVALCPSFALAQGECLQAFVETDAGPSTRLYDSGDVNGDGRPDLLMAFTQLGRLGASSTSYIVVALGDGAAGFQLLEPVAVDDRSSMAQLVDLNEDGRDDVVAASYSDRRVVRWLAAEDGHLRARRNIRVGQRVYDVGVGDFDGDGHADVAATSLDGLRIFRGNGRGGLRRGQTIREGRMPTIPMSADFDGDGSRDLFVLHNDSASGSTYRGGRRFRNVESFETCESPYTPLVADVDRDGRDDVVYSCSNRGVRWYRNAGGMRMVEAGFLAEGARNPWISMGDIDADGDDELVVTSEIGRHLLVLERDAQGLFQERARATFDGQSFFRPQIADFDGDGTMDNRGRGTRARRKSHSGVLRARLPIVFRMCAGMCAGV